MKRLFFILLLVPVFTSGQKMSAKKKQSPFSDLVKNIKTIGLPFSHKCGNDFDIIQNVDTELYRYFPPLYSNHPEYGWHIVGKVSENSRYVALLSVNTYADIAIPYLVTFTNQGAPITKFEFYQIECTEDDFYHGETIFTISKELSISICDSTSRYKRDDAGEIIRASIISTADRRRFKLKNDGTIAPSLTQISN